MNEHRRRRILEKVAEEQLRQQSYGVSADAAVQKQNPIRWGLQSAYRNATPALSALYDNTFGKVGEGVAQAQDGVHGAREMADLRRFGRAEDMRTVIADNKDPWSAGAMGRRAVTGVQVGASVAAPLLGGLRAAGLRSGVELAKGGVVGAARAGALPAGGAATLASNVSDIVGTTQSATAKPAGN